MTVRVITYPKVIGIPEGRHCRLKIHAAIFTTGEHLVITRSLPCHPWYQVWIGPKNHLKEIPHSNIIEIKEDSDAYGHIWEKPIIHVRIKQNEIIREFTFNKDKGLFDSKYPIFLFHNK